jgi:hypothetical protein
METKPNPEDFPEDSYEENFSVRGCPNAKALPAKIVESHQVRGAVSIRDVAGSATGLKHVLTYVGFDPGDDVVILDRATFDDLRGRNPF